jgi:hypothetical protein
LSSDAGEFLQDGCGYIRDAGSATNRTRKTGDTFPDLPFPIYRGCANMNYDRNAISSQLPVPDLPIVSTILLVREALRSDTSGSVGRRV